MLERPFHHGNLRAVLLDEAAGVLRESGVGGLSLRDLARRAGVSHGAPRSHFVDRQALLDALAVLGFERLTTSVREALAQKGPPRSRFRRVARAYVGFAIDDAALMDLMFQAKTDGQSDAVRDAAVGLFTVLDETLGTRQPVDEGNEDGKAHQLFSMLFVASLQGIAALVASDRIDRALGDRLVDAAVDTMLSSDLGARAVPRP